MITDAETMASTEAALGPFVRAAQKKLPVPMLRLYSKWMTGNKACVSAALRAECQTLLADIILPDGRVQKTECSPDGRRPVNTTYHMVPTSMAVFAMIVRNVRKVREMQYRFLTDASAEISGRPGERLIDVTQAVPATDMVVALERTRMTLKRPASLSAKLLIGNIDHDQNVINVEHEIPLFAETLDAAAVAPPEPTAARIFVPVSSKVAKGTFTEE